MDFEAERVENGWGDLLLSSGVGAFVISGEEFWVEEKGDLDGVAEISAVDWSLI
jgi:hypothetical protein